MEEANPQMATTSFQVEGSKVSPEPPFIQDKHPQLVLTRLILQTFHQFFHCPSLDSPQQLNVIPAVRSPELDTGIDTYALYDIFSLCYLVFEAQRG